MITETIAGDMKKLPGAQVWVNKHGDVWKWGRDGNFGKHGRIPATYYRSAGGKKCVWIRIDGEPANRPVDRLVGELFCPDFRPELRAKYLDGNRDNCAASNLRWVSVAETTRAPRGGEKSTDKLTAEIVREIRTSDESISALAKRLDVGYTTVAQARKGRTWKNVE